MDLTVEDRLAIHELIALHGHLMEDGAFDRLGELVTDDVIYDVTDQGGGELDRDGIRAAGLALGDGNPLGHHVTNVMIVSVVDGVVHVRSKGFGVMSDGTVGTVGYEDEIVNTDSGWRIARRKVLSRRRPLHRD